MNKPTFIVIQLFDDGSAFVGRTHDIEEPVAQVVQRCYDANDLYQVVDETTETEQTVPMCAVHHVPMVRIQGKKGPFWSCHQRNADNSFCTYRPPKA